MTARCRRATGPLLLAAVLLAGCGSAAQPTATTPPQDAAEAAGNVERAGEPAPDVRFLTLTAEHVCEVQGQIYATPEDLAEAQAELPDYSGIDAATVAELQQRLTTDAAFSARLNDLVSQGCG